MAALAAKHDLIICVDCGTLSHDPIAAAKGADVIVLDHHLGGETLPTALAVVNPNRQDEDGELAHLCAAAVVFLMLVEADRQLRETGQAGPDLMAMLDLVALATVADVAPLIGVNRAFVRQGLTVMAQRDRPGLAALADVARMDTAPRPITSAFCWGRASMPAGGSDRPIWARVCWPAPTHMRPPRWLNGSTAQHRAPRCRGRGARRSTGSGRSAGFDAPLVWAAGDGWHPGVVGIVASRLKEATNRPAIVIGLRMAIGKGSGRSVSGIDLGAPIQRLAAEGLLIKGGGHKMAAGLTVAEDKLEAAMARLGELLAKQGAHLAGAADLTVDGMLMPGAATWN